VDALAATVGAVFPSVFLIDEPGPPDQLGNTLLVATMQPKDLDSFRQSVAALPSSLPDEFHNFVAQAAPLARVAQLPLDATIFTDDHAPVERIVHQIIVSYLRGE
jgi:hypothetical protein